MSRLIDADALKEGKFHSTEDWTPIESASWRWGWNDAIDAIINNAPIVDAVPVVRCKDCQYSRPKKSGIKLHCAWWYRSVEDEDFCSRGRRKKE